MSGQCLSYFVTFLDLIIMDMMKKFERSVCGFKSELESVRSRIFMHIWSVQHNLAWLLNAASSIMIKKKIVIKFFLSKP